MSNLTFDSICKSDNEFSFLSTIVDLVGNRQFKNGTTQALCSDVTYAQNAQSNIWLSLSAIGQQIGGVFQQNINNFIDNILNVDVCNVKGLQSLADIVGTNYSIFNNIANFPIDIIKLIDVLSIKKEYLANSSVVKRKLAEEVMEYAGSDATEEAVEIANAINSRRAEISAACGYDIPAYQSISANWHDENVSTARRLDLSALDNVINDTFFSFICNKISATYNDVLSTMIYEDLSNEILNENFALPNEYAEDIQKVRLQYNVDDKFNTQAEADNIDNGLSTYDDYTEYQKKMLDLEFQRRSDAFDPIQLNTRYAYYKQLEVKTYFEFIKNYYMQLDQSYLSVQQYNVDDNYFVLCSDFYQQKSLLAVDETGKCQIKTDWIRYVVNDLQYLVSTIREIREQLKHFCQKNFMKGTFLLISYVINEYLKCNTLTALGKAKFQSQTSSLIEGTPAFEADSNYSTLVEYLDPINYFNISTEMAELTTSTNVNPRYWEVNSTVSAIGAIDSTNIFSVPPTVNANVFAFNIQQISAFYCNTMKMQFSNYALKSLSGMSYTDHLSKFLAEVFDLGADKMHKDDAGKIVYEVEDNALSTYKEDLYYRYTADANGEFPFYYYSNLTHPSYQIHPYLSSFMEKADYSYPIQNIASIVQEEVMSLVKNNIDQYIDEDGYLKSLWKNPLGANQDYQSAYEKSTHIDYNNDLNQQVDYDGLFYPPAIQQLKDNPNEMIAMLSADGIISTETSDGTVLMNYYYGVELYDGDRAKLVKQLTHLRQYLLKIAFNANTTIYQYGADMYHNKYMLVKDVNAVDNFKTIRDKGGVLLIRKNSHPIAFPAYVVRDAGSSLAKNDNNLAALYTYDDSKNISNRFIYNSAAQYAQLATGIQTPLINDFFISIDKQDIIFAENSKIAADTSIRIPIATVANEYLANIKQNTLQLNKVTSLQTSIDMLFTESGYSLGCFTNIENKLAAIMQKRMNDTVTLAGAVFDYSNQFNSSPIVQLPAKTITATGIKQDADVVLDANNDGMLALAYVTSTAPTNVKSYLGNNFSYSDDNEYAKTLTRMLDSNIAVKTFKVRNTFDEIDVETQTADKTTSYYNAFTDNGFFGLFQNIGKDNIDNDIYDSYLLAENENRHMLKFQLLGDAKTGDMIDYKFCLPVRVREGYDVDAERHNDYSIVKYDYAHFMEDVIEASRHSTAADADSHFEPITVNKVLNGNSASLEIDEEFFIKMKDNFSLTSYYRMYNDLLLAPYLIAGNVPTQYINPGTDSEQPRAADDNFSFKMYDDVPAISCSWKIMQAGKIALDFNTAFYNDIGEGNNNYFNEKRCFLHLDKPGEAGYLNVYMAGGFSEESVTFYIKNISDKHPKFIMSTVARYSKADKFLLCENNANGFILLQNGNCIK